MPNNSARFFGRLLKHQCPVFLLLLILSTTALPAQDQSPLDWPAFRSLVLRNHPLARQADLYRDQAKAGLLRAGGAFDPKVYADYSSKNFNHKNYFQYTETGLKWPVGLGLEFKGNYNWAYGAFLNTESKLPAQGQLAAGFNWTLGQGLFIDDRRAAKQQARIGLAAGEAERSALLNDLLVEAAKAYWTWAVAEDQVRLYEQALQQAQVRYRGLLDSWNQGDKPAIDTLEAFIQVQNRQIELNFARVEVQNARLSLTNFWWNDDDTPAQPETSPRPTSLLVAAPAPDEKPDPDQLLAWARTRHPGLQLYDAKLRELDVERRLKKEKRKPVLDLNYNLLGNGWQFFPTASDDAVGLIANDIKWGLQFSFPILNRKARGDWQITQVKIAQTGLQRQQKQLEVENKIRQYLNELNTLAGQTELYRDMTNNYRRLLEGENEKFLLGESSIFLINTREQRWLDAQIKLVKLLGEYRKTEAALQWAAGVLAD